MSATGSRITHRYGDHLFLAATIIIGGSRTAAAQAWVPPAGNGSVSVVYQTIDNTGHLLTNGFELPDGKSTDTSIYLEAEYALSDRLSLAAGLPYVFAKYRGPGPGPFGFLPIDSCFCWHSAWQDFGLTARYNIVNANIGLTPFVAIGVPSHQYPFQGEAVVGHGLREVRVGLDAGQRLDVISNRLSIQGHYSYAMVEQVVDMPNNRSNAGVEGAYLLTNKLLVRGLSLWQRTHGGLRAGADPPDALGFMGEINTPERRLQHDRLLRDNYWHLGASVSYSLPRVDLFSSYIHYVRGTDSHMGHVFSVGASWPFELTR
jgi:hypothetical protein